MPKITGLDAQDLLREGTSLYDHKTYLHQKQADLAALRLSAEEAHAKRQKRAGK